MTSALCKGWRSLLKQRLAAAAAAMFALALLVVSNPASASAAPAWRIDSSADTTVAPGGSLDYQLQLTNTGSTDSTAPADPTCDPNNLPMDPDCTTITANLPAGMTATGISSGFATGNFNCAGLGVPGPTTISCASSDVLTAPINSSSGSFRIPTLTVSVDPSASGTLTSVFQADGGGVSDPATTSDPTTVSDTLPGFGIDSFDAQVASDPQGDPFTQAGGHPYSASTDIDFNRVTNPNPLLGPTWPAAAVRDIVVDLPPGFVGNPSVAAKCSMPELANSQGAEVRSLCPPASQLGTTLVRVTGAHSGAENVMGPLPVFNMVPPPGVPARLGFNVSGTIVTLDASLRSDADYGVTVNARYTPEGVPLVGTSLTLWGVPADSSHDSERACPGRNPPPLGGPSCQSGAPLTAFLRNPTSCMPPGVGLATTLHVDSWVDPGAFQDATTLSHLPPGFPAPPADRGAVQGITGCEAVPFAPALTAAPQLPVRTNTPAGLTVDLSLPQSDEPSAIGEADLKRAVVTFPAGVRVSPSSADGLGACSPAQIGLLGTGFPEPNKIRFNTDEPSCPDSSRLGSVSVQTPLLEKPLTGSVYLASPHENPFGTLVALYLVAKGPGVIVKLPGRVDLDPSTGQIITTFDDNPQLPFSNLHIELKSGPRAALVMPEACGTYTTHSELTSWSGKTVVSDSPFTVAEGPDGGPCAPASFNPSFQTIASSVLAGTFSPFALRLARSDGEGELASLSTLSMPPGLLADAASVPVRCSDAQASAAACPAASRIGGVTVGAGPGPNPYYVSGDVYLMSRFASGPFAGDPFGIAVIVHAAAGPFDLGYTVVKGGIQIHDDGSIAVQTEPFPRILQGIPLQLRDVRVNLDRPGFMLNPTNCSPWAVSASVQSTGGQSVAVSSPFQAGECRALAFKPKFSVSTAGRTSKANGASLRVHIATHEGPSAGGAASRESNIAKVDVQLPVVLPARLPTLQKACTAAQFASDPAGCPVGSFVGSAIAHTPILASPLSGPAILVSHGGEAFPDLVLVLQGEGVRLNVTGHTQIKKGITFSHFETVPDAPVSSFDLTLPQGPHAVLTTDIPGRNLCATTRVVTVRRRVTRRIHGRRRKVLVKTRRTVAAPLLMPTTITAQSGAVVNQATKITVTGCAKAKPRKTTKANTGKRTGSEETRKTAYLIF
jgi:hypothetical protein